MEQKKFMDIKRIVQENEMHKNKNTWAFEPGDHIVIQIKIDGSNASVRYDPETGKLAAFSRKQQIVRTKDVDATSKFLDYVDTLDAEKFQKYPDYVFFGEWMTRHRVPYPEKYLNIWIMYDVYDLKADGYLPQKQVKALAAEEFRIYMCCMTDLSWTGITVGVSCGLRSIRMGTARKALSSRICRN